MRVYDTAEFKDSKKWVRYERTLSKAMKTESTNFRMMLYLFFDNFLSADNIDAWLQTIKHISLLHTALQ